MCGHPSQFGSWVARIGERWAYRIDGGESRWNCRRWQKIRGGVARNPSRLSRRRQYCVRMPADGAAGRSTPSPMPSRSPFLVLSHSFRPLSPRYTETESSQPRARSPSAAANRITAPLDTLSAPLPLRKDAQALFVAQAVLKEQNS